MMSHCNLSQLKDQSMPNASIAHVKGRQCVSLQVTFSKANPTLLEEFEMNFRSDLECSPYLAALICIASFAKMCLFRNQFQVKNKICFLGIDFRDLRSKVARWVICAAKGRDYCRWCPNLSRQRSFQQR